MAEEYKRLRVEMKELEKRIDAEVAKKRDEAEEEVVRMRRVPEHREIEKKLDRIERRLEAEEMRAFKALDDEVKRQREVGVTAATALSDLRAMRLLYIAAVKAADAYGELSQDDDDDFFADDDFEDHTHVLRHMADLVALIDL
jgi:hypothetical protein